MKRNVDLDMCNLCGLSDKKGKCRCPVPEHGCHWNISRGERKSPWCREKDRNGGDLEGLDRTFPDGVMTAPIYHWRRLSYTEKVHILWKTGGYPEWNYSYL